MPNYPGFKAGNTIAPARFVTLDDGSATPAQSTLWQGTANAKPYGVMQEGSQDTDAAVAANAGDDSFVVHTSMTAYLELGGSVSIDDWIISDTDGTGIVVPAIGTTNQNIGARALQDGVSGEKILVEVVRVVQRPALA